MVFEAVFKHGELEQNVIVTLAENLSFAVLIKGLQGAQFKLNVIPSEKITQIVKVGSDPYES